MVNSNKGRKFPPQVFNKNEIQALLRACSSAASTGIRNRAMIAIGYRAGLRINEVLTLQVKDLDPEAGSLHVLQGKGGKSRVVGLDQGTIALVEQWLDTRRKIGIGQRRRLFTTLKGDPIESAYVRALMARIGKKAGLAKRVSFHCLRHSFAWELSQEGVPVIEIKGLLGHSNLAVTSRYLDHVAPHDRIERLRKREWVSP